MGDIAEDRWRIDRHAAEGRLQADDAAKRGRNADRAAGIGADRERTDAGRHGGGAAAAAAAGGAFDVPRVAGDPAERRVGDRLPAEFGRRGLAEEHRTFTAQPGGDRRILVHSWFGSMVREPKRRGQPRVRTVSLIATGTPSRRPCRLTFLPARLRGARLGHRALRVIKDEGVEGPFVPFEPAQRLCHHFDRRDLPAPVQREQPCGRQKSGRLGHAVLLSS